MGEAGAQIVLRAPLDGPQGSHAFVCRYQVRFKEERVGAEWVEQSVQMLWHRQNDHLASADPPVDAQGAVVTGLGPRGEGPNDEPAGQEGAEVRRSVIPAEVRSSVIPTLPLPAAGPAGTVPAQRCLVAVLREEDGLRLDSGYTFSVRVVVLMIYCLMQ